MRYYNNSDWWVNVVKIFSANVQPYRNQEVDCINTT